MIRKMTIEDLKSVLAIENEVFSSPYNETQYAYEIEDNPCAYLYVYEENEEIIGYIDFWVTFDSSQLCKIAVNKKYQKQGYGRAMMEFMFDTIEKQDCETIFLEVRVSNEPAIAFYESLGFIEINKRKNYYSNPSEDALILGSFIKGEDDGR